MIMDLSCDAGEFEADEVSDARRMTFAGVFASPGAPPATLAGQRRGNCGALVPGEAGEADERAAEGAGRVFGQREAVRQQRGAPVLRSRGGVAVAGGGVQAGEPDPA